MSKYTVSKWHVDPDGYILSETGDYIASVAIVCDDEKRQVNTRLIAVAPEMYKGLRECLDFIEDIISRNCDCSLQLDAEGLRETLEELLARIDGKEEES